MKRLQSALDNEVYISVQRFVADGVATDSNSLYSALQKSNSSLKRRPKKVLLGSIDRVLSFMGVEETSGQDSEAEIEKTQAQSTPDPDLMNKSLRSTLSAVPVKMEDDGPKKRRLANGEPIPKRQKPEKVTTLPPSDLSLNDIGGMDNVVSQMGELLSLPLLKSEQYRAMRLPLPRGILLYGPPGCGKTMVTRAFAAQLGVPFIEILGPSIVSSMSGDSEKSIRERFEEAKKNAPSLIFIDEIDAIAPKRESSQSQMEKRIVAQLLVCMDELGRDYDKPVIVLAATNRPDTIDPALRRGGRFDTEINIPVPNELAREQILTTKTRELRLAPDVDFRALAKMTAGFVGADLQDLVSKAGSWTMTQYRQALRKQATDLASNNLMEFYVESGQQQPSAAVMAEVTLIRRLRMSGIPEPPGFEDHSISMTAFTTILPDITPSSKREGFATIPDVSWEDVGALNSVREELQDSIVEPIQNPEEFKKYGLKLAAGILLWGPPGCGKTLLAKAVAAESKANFIAVKGPELLDKYVGESEAAVRRVFTRARSSIPCIVFFDEIDALVPNRNDAGSESSSRLVNALLSELDGLGDREGVYVIAATNRPDMIDNAMLRHGRLGDVLYVDLPGPNERVEILSTLLRGKKAKEVPQVLEAIRQKYYDGFSGADLEGLLQKAGKIAFKRKANEIELQDFLEASETITASVTDIDRYHAMRQSMKRM